MEELKQLQKRYCSRAMALAIAGALIFIIFGYNPLGRGLVLGTLFSIINFILMGQSIQARMGKTQARTTFLALVSVFFRFALMAVPIVVAVKFESYHIVTAVIGLFMVQIVLFAENIKNLVWNKSTATGTGKLS